MRSDADATGPFHAGELAVQARAGVRAFATRVGGIIGATIPPAFTPFLATARVVAAGAADGEGVVWATMLLGPPGFVEASPTRLRVRATPTARDALRPVLTRHAPPDPPTAVGLTIIDLATRRRVRVNGRRVPDDDPGDPRVGGFTVAVEEAYVNCPKYIHARTAPSTVAAGELPHPAVEESDGLTDAQRAWLGAADTAFLASVGPTGRADVSHRGGAPGFLVAADARRVVLPDYAGNAMFNTLGNLAADPRAGLVVPDFATGRLLQLAGSAAVDWRSDAAASFPGAERVVVFSIERVREVGGALPTGWTAPVASPFTPPSPRALRPTRPDGPGRADPSRDTAP